MEMISSSRNLANVGLSRDEIVVLHAALNEICNGIDVFEFDTRIGVNLEFATNLLQALGSVLDGMDHLSG
ncbi:MULTISPECIES: hypothetical protein [unclassified Achromobacter]|uniref:hypothetical protein n=1 Tax=unclassified Achromobacter TaxID=2626865 RepID=UPI000E70E611|nr:hypothetical protein [Achromobacter sp. B7]AYD67038.1 hypothetical protein DVB37_26310 [Achromobacter sp. B7]